MLPNSLEHMLGFIHTAYAMMVPLYEIVLVVEDTWIECQGNRDIWIEHLYNSDTWIEHLSDSDTCLYNPKT